VFKVRIQTVFLLFAAGVGVIVAFVMGLFLYVSATAKPIHPDAQNVPTVTHQAPTAEWDGAVQQARQIARSGLVEQNLPGLSVAVGVGNELVWAEGLGLADLENRVPVSPHLRFRIGTASKMLTSAGIGLLLEQNKLLLDDEIQTFVPAFPRKQWPVTLRQLMGHTAGVRTDGGDEEPRTASCPGTLDALPRFAESSLRFEPGTQYRYSNYGWILVSGAVEAVAKEPFFTFMQTQVFKPLGMEDTTSDTATKPVPDSAVFYFPKFGGDPSYGPQGPEHEMDHSCFAGSAGFLTTASDLVRFGMAIHSGTLLKPATVQLLQTSHTLPSGEETGYGLGWDLETVTFLGEPKRVVGYDGEIMGGIAMSFMMFPDHGLVVAVLSNTAYAETPSIALKIAEAFAEKGKRPAAK
jgi:CubicO group peptidase (beta-lactamase class C family)